MIDTKKIFSTPNDGKHYFFGYYDKSPVSADQNKLLALQVDFLDHIPEKGDKAIIGYFDLSILDGKFIPLTETSTFNWQQGCMLQWLGPEFDSKIIFNDLRNSKFCSVIFDLDTGKEEILPMAIYTLTSDGRTALCIDHERHHWCRRGYSYDGISNEAKNKNIVPGDGIFSLDIERKKVKKIIKIEEMNSIKPFTSMREGNNYLEHMMISPDNNQFAFTHRWKHLNMMHSRIYVANIDGSNIRLLNDVGRASHFNWRTESELLVWCGLKNTINNLRKYKILNKFIFSPLLPLYRKLTKGNSIQGNTSISSALTGDSMVLFDVNKLTHKRIGQDVLLKDGHPSISPLNQNIMLYDSYPGPESAPELLIYNIEKNILTKLDVLKSIPLYDESPLRCDLHPKWSFCGNFISIDTMDKGKRDMYLYKISMNE